MKTLERGFKTWAERTALAFRRELGLTVNDPLPPERFATYLGIQLWTPRNIPDLPPEVTEQLLEKDPWGWSAISLNGIIIYNPRKSKGRRASDIMHELAHILLDHRPAIILLSPDLPIGMRSFDAKQEDEANWLAGCLLLPREGLLNAKRRKLLVEQIAEHYGVTGALVNFRVNLTGIQSQVRARKQ
ncbi:MAG: ImmA/IrrE family metallo-endopeptidase [Blastocatellales bacterium]